MISPRNLVAAKIRYGKCARVREKRVSRKEGGGSDGDGSGGDSGLGSGSGGGSGGGDGGGGGGGGGGIGGEVTHTTKCDT